MAYNFRTEVADSINRLHGISIKAVQQWLEAKNIHDAGDFNRETSNGTNIRNAIFSYLFEGA